MQIYIQTRTRTAAKCATLDESVTRKRYIWNEESKVAHYIIIVPFFKSGTLYYFSYPNTHPNSCEMRNTEWLSIVSESAEDIAIAWRHAAQRVDVWEFCCHPLHHTATHFYTTQRTATHCNTTTHLVNMPQIHTASYCNKGRFRPMYGSLWPKHTSGIYALCHTYIWMSHDAHMNMSCHTFEWVTFKHTCGTCVYFLWCLPTRLRIDAQPSTERKE